MERLSAALNPLLSELFCPARTWIPWRGCCTCAKFQPFFVFATPAVRRILQQENRIFRVLERADPPVKWVALSSKGRLGCHLEEEPGSAPEFLCTTVPLGSSYPDYVSEELQRVLAPEEATSGFVIHQGDKRLFYAPSIPADAPVTSGSGGWRSWVESSDAAFLDGTFWSDDELIATGRSKKTAREIGHTPLSGPAGLVCAIFDAQQGPRS